jgi:hypothetical protein
MNYEDFQKLALSIEQCPNCSDLLEIKDDKNFKEIRCLCGDFYLDNLEQVLRHISIDNLLYVFYFWYYPGSYDGKEYFSLYCDSPKSNFDWKYLGFNENIFNILTKCNNKELTKFIQNIELLK